MKARGITSPSPRRTSANAGADGDREPDHPHARGEGVVGPGRPELLADDDLTGDRDRVEDEREEDPELERDLVGGERRVAEPGHDDAREHERREQRDGADEDELAEREQAPREVGPEPGVRETDAPQDRDRHRDPHPRLRDDRPPGRALDPEVEAVDEHDLEHEVDDVPGDHDQKRRPQVGDAAEKALAADREERRRDPERRDPQVRDGVRRGLPLDAE